MPGRSEHIRMTQDILSKELPPLFDELYRDSAVSHIAATIVDSLQYHFGIGEHDRDPTD